MNRRDAETVLEALETFDAELEQLEISNDWFVSDSRDRLKTATQIMYEELGIREETYDEDEEEPEQTALVFREEC